MKNLKFFFIFFFLSLFVSNSFGIDIEVEIRETSILTKLLSSQYSLSAQGVLSVYNPSNVSRVYEFNFPLELDSLIGISKIDKTSSYEVVTTLNTTTFYDCNNCSNGNVSLFNCSECLNCSTGFTNFSSCFSCFNLTQNISSELTCSNCSVNVSYYNVTSNVDYLQSEKFKFGFDKISGFMINPGEKVEVGYKIFGILDYNIYDRLNSSNDAVLDYYIDSYDFISSVILNLDKPDREGSIYNIDGTLNASYGVANTTRVVSAVVRNPTDFNYYFKNLKLFKTTVADPFFDSGNMIKAYYNFSIEPFSYRSVDYTDKHANDKSVYWMSSVVLIDYNIFFNVTHDFKIQASSVSSGGGSNGGSGSWSGFVEKFNSILIKKDVDTTMVRDGEEFKVYLRIVNINDFALHNLTVFDEVPSNYEIRDISGNVQVAGNDISFFIEDIEEYETIVLSYSLVLNEEYKGITYLKPAKLIYNFQEFFSQGVLLINDLLPTDKVFVQKEIRFIDDEFAEVVITVKNLGNYLLEDIMISDDISEMSIIKDISKMFFEKGVWRIKSLGAGEEWQVSYLIRRDGETFDSLPNVFGVDKSDVYGTLIFSEEIVTIFKDEPGIIEKVGLSVAVGFLVIYLLF